MIFNFTALSKEESHYLDDGMFLIYQKEDGSILVGTLEITSYTSGKIEHYFVRHGGEKKQCWQIGMWAKYSKMTPDDEFLYRLES